jgi:hypothetical protein
VFCGQVDDNQQCRRGVVRSLACWSGLLPREESLEPVVQVVQVMQVEARSALLVRALPAFELDLSQTLLCARTQRRKENCSPG